MENALIFGVAALVAWKSGILNGLVGNITNAAQGAPNGANPAPSQGAYPQQPQSPYAAQGANGNWMPAQQQSGGGTDWGSVAGGIGSGLASLISSITSSAASGTKKKPGSQSTTPYEDAFDFGSQNPDIDWDYEGAGVYDPYSDPNF